MMLFPFSAIVGQDKAKLALICNAIDPTIGGVLLSGDKGTGKSTMVRALSQVLPEIEVVEGCVFNCDPRNVFEMCDSCKGKAERGEIKVVKRKMRVIDLPLSVTLDRLVGTIDVSRALREGIRALQPGILAEANRNILYIDEVNLLEDYVADVLLDAAAMGWNVVEREGISLRHPSKFILVGSMNPEEGELRPQLLDRFGMFVAIEASQNVEERIEIVRRVQEFQRDLRAFYEKYRSQDEMLKERILKAKELLNRVEIEDDLLKLMVETIVRLGIKTHRAEITTVKAAKAIAAFEGRRKVSVEDIDKAMELTLPHRLKSKPFQRPNVLQFLKKLESESQVKSMKLEVGSDKGGNIESSTNPRNAMGNLEVKFDSAELQVDDNHRVGKGEGLGGRTSRKCKITLIGEPMGIPISYAPLIKESIDVNFFATINSALSRGFPIEIKEEDIKINVRKAKGSKLTTIILDASGSMSLEKKMSIAKGIAKKMIENSYRRRELLSLIVFNRDDARVIVNPTKNYEEVFNAIDLISTGGKTPLPAALFKLLQIANKVKKRKVKVSGVLITDGKANVPLFGRVEEDLKRMCNLLVKEGVELEIYDTRPSAFDPSPSYVDLISSLTNASVWKV